jgi:hypothetical protein
MDISIVNTSLTERNASHHSAFKRFKMCCYVDVLISLIRAEPLEIYVLMYYFKTRFLSFEEAILENTVNIYTLENYHSIIEY